MLSPDFANRRSVRLERHPRHAAIRSADAIREAQEAEGTVVIDFRVRRRQRVSMVPAGADLHNMIRRPIPQNVLVESGGDAEWDISVK
jgi:acetolactate synthase-1/2/3 large subunit